MREHAADILFEKSNDTGNSELNDRQVDLSREKFLQLAQCFYDKMSQFSVKLLDPLLDENVVGFLNLSSARDFWRKDFSRQEIFTSCCLIAKISASQKFPTRR